MGALQYIDRPGYAALLMRRQEVDLYKEGAILDRATKWFEGTPAHWDGDAKCFRFPSTATITFGHLAGARDHGKWKGPAFQYIGFEELTEWEQSDYLFMFSRLRGLIGGVPTRARAATNPGGIGHDWVWERFVRFAKQLGTDTLYSEWIKGEKKGAPYFASEPSSQAIDIANTLGVVAQGAYFVPAFAEDNPSLNVVEYMLNLAKLDPVELAWYAKGDWSAVPSGRYFQRAWFHYLDDKPRDVFWLRYWDLAGTEEIEQPGKPKKDPAWSAGTLLGIQHNEQTKSNRLVIADCERARLEPADVEDFVLVKAKEDGRGVPIVIEQEPGSSGKATIVNYQRKVLFGWNVEGDKKTGSKEAMWLTLASLAKAGGVWLVRGPWNEAFVKELVSLPVGKKDQADSASGGYAWCVGDSGGRLARIRGLSRL
jgi:phage terminase large subunit-like protein